MRRTVVALFVGGFVIVGASSTGCGGGGACAGSLSVCSGFCYDLKTSAEHCGLCNIACSSGQSCVNGACVRGGTNDDGGTTLPDGSPDDGSTSGPPDVAPGSDPCRSVTQSGVYCGTSTQGNFDSTKANPLSLYVCNNGVTVNTQSCGAPGCADEGASSYCECPCWEGAGSYCGSAIQTYATNNGGCGTVQGGAMPNSLYSCTGGGTWKLTTACTNNCVANTGATDACFCEGGKACGSNCCAATDWCGVKNQTVCCNNNNCMTNVACGLC